MYSTYWGLTESPFRNTINTRWYHDSQVHEEALARLFFLVEQGRRCGVLVGPAGTGKSFLVRLLSRQIGRTQRQVASVDLLGLGCDEMLVQLADALRLGSTQTRAVALWRELEDFLKGSQACRVQTVVVFDHVERATAEAVCALERLLHIGGSAAGFVTVVIAGRTLDSPFCSTSLEHLPDLRIEIAALDRRQTGLYVEQLLRRAGCEAKIFDEMALDALYELSGGVPRDINRLCDLSLLAAMAAEQPCVDDRILMSASLELKIRREFGRTPAGAEAHC